MVTTQVSSYESIVICLLLVLLPVGLWLSLSELLACWVLCLVLNFRIGFAFWLVDY